MAEWDVPGVPGAASEPVWGVQAACSRVGTADFGYESRRVRLVAEGIRVSS